MTLAVRRFPLAPMSPLFTVLTLIVLGVIGLVGVLGLVNGVPAMVATSGLMAVGAALLWVWLRPTSFEIDEGALVIRWPMRRRAIPRASVTAARVLDANALRRVVGVAVRVGAGGLFGTFGLLWTSRRGWIETYISKTTGLVLIDFRDRRPLLITPSDPEVFAAALGARLDTRRDLD